MQLEVKEIIIPQEISFNYEELKTELAEKVRTYEMMVYTDDQIKEAKADKASLNKLKKALNDERIRREREYMKPFNEFKAQVNEIIAIIDRPIAVIDKQVKEYEELQKEAKTKEIRDYMAGYKLPYDIDIMKIFQQRWLNASVSMTAIRKEIDERVIGIQADLESLEDDLDEYQSFAISYYRETLDLRATLNEIKRQKEIKAMQAKIEAEQAEKKKAAPAEPVKEEKPVQPEPEKPAGQWIRFAAFLTASQAAELKDFFVRRGIEYKAI